MSGFDITFEQVYPFSGVDMMLEEVRVSVTVFAKTYEIDQILIPATGTKDGWIVLDHLHPIYLGSCLTDGLRHFLDAEKQVRAIEAKVAEVRAEEREDAGVSRRTRYAEAA